MPWPCCKQANCMRESVLRALFSSWSWSARRAAPVILFLLLPLVWATLDMSTPFFTTSSTSPSRNALGGPLAPCGTSPMTGFYRNGFCETGPQDTGRHTVCAEVTSAFLAFTRSRGNDLSTPNHRSAFPGLRDGDRWCLCVDRWLEAERSGNAPPVDLEATHERALDRAGLRLLQRYSTTDPHQHDT